MTTRVALLEMKQRLHDILSNAILRHQDLELVEWKGQLSTEPENDQQPDVLILEANDPKDTALPARLLNIRLGSRILVVSDTGADAAIYQLRLDHDFIANVAMDQLLDAIRFGVDGVSSTKRVH